jgi:hypothetical protein
MTGPNLPTGYNLASPLPLSSVCIPSMRLKAALLPREIVGKARKMRLETRHGEIHECPDLRTWRHTIAYRSPASLNLNERAVR